jgi:hypothetical protein
MGRTQRRRASLVAALQNIATSFTGDLTLDAEPQRNRSPSKRTVCLDPSTPTAIDENHNEIVDCPCHSPPYKFLGQCRRSQRTLCFGRIGALSSTSAPIAATITDTEDDDISSSKQSNNVHPRHGEAKFTFKSQNKCTQESALHPMIGRSSLRSGATMNGIPNPFPRTFDSSPAKSRRCCEKRVEVKRRADRTQKHAMVFPIVLLAISDRPKRERILTDFFEPSFKQKIKCTGNESKSKSPSEAKNPLPSIPSSRPKVGKVQQRVSKSPRTASLRCFDIPSEGTSPSNSDLVLGKRYRVPTNFYQPNAPTTKAIQIADTSQKRYLDKKRDHSDVTITVSRKTSKRLSRSHCALFGTLVATEQYKCRETVVRLMLGTYRSKISAAVRSRSRTRYVRALQNCGVSVMNAPPNFSIAAGPAPQEWTNIKTRNILQNPTKVVKFAGISARSRSSQSMKGNRSCFPQNSTALVENVGGIVSGNQQVLIDNSLKSTVSYDTLLSQYDDKVSQGLCRRVHFGRTLQSANAAIDRMLREMTKEVSENINDPDILADTREYKRSLRFFSIYEDREKLALVHEAQEDMETRGRMEVMSKAKQLSAGKERSELHLLGNRPVIFRSSSFASRRCNLQCRSGPSCAICGSDGQVDSNVVSHRSKFTPIPMIKPFDIDSATEVSSTVSTRKRKRKCIQHSNVSRATIDALTELKYSLQFVEQYHDDRLTFRNNCEEIR